MAWTGSIVSVNGSNRAAPVVAPKPGRTPITIPIIVVAKIRNKRYGSRKTEPRAVAASSIFDCSYP
jgi:hypothetical protein